VEPTKLLNMRWQCQSSLSQFPHAAVCMLPGDTRARNDAPACMLCCMSSHFAHNASVKAHMMSSMLCGCFHMPSMLCGMISHFHTMHLTSHTMHL